MEPNLQNSLNPTPFTANYAKEGLFKDVGGMGNIFKRVGDKLVSFDPVLLLTPQERQSAGGYFAQQSLAAQKLKSQYGFDISTLPIVNIGDMFSADLALQRARPNYFQNGFADNITDVNQIIGTPPAQIGSTQLNTQKNSLSAPTITPSDSSTNNGLTYNASSGTITPPEHGFAPSKALQPGMSGSDVKELQLFLVNHGYSIPDGPTGFYGDQTKAAVAKFQSDNGIQAGQYAGFFGPQTIGFLQANPQVKSASTATPTPPTSPSSTSTTTPDAPHANDDALKTLLANPSLSADQKSAIQAIYNAVATNDTEKAAKITAAMKAATEFSDPYFKSQIRLVTDALSRGLTSKEGDLSFSENQLRSALNATKADIAASKDKLSFQQNQDLLALQRKYEAELETTQNDLANNGFTSSSRRSKAEGLLNDARGNLIESTNRNFAFNTNALDRTLATNESDTQSRLANIQRLAAEGKLDLLRTAEEKVGSTNLSNLGYSGILGNVGGTIPRQQVTDATNFATNFVF